MRLVPRSYFWTCWNLMPSIVASFSWLNPRSARRRRNRDPICASMVECSGNPGRLGMGADLRQNNTTLRRWVRMSSDRIGKIGKLANSG
jgi:hypothetical protein